MMKRDVRYLISIFMMIAMLCGLGGCTSIDNNGGTGQIVAEAVDEEITAEDILDKAEQTGSGEESKETEKLSSGGEVMETEKTSSYEESGKTEEASSGEDLDQVVPNAADDNWYMKGNIYTDDKGNRLEVFFNDYGVLQFAVNGLSMYITRADNFQQENNWKIYTCDDGTMIGYYPGEPSHLEIMDGDYAGLYEAGGDKMN